MGKFAPTAGTLLAAILLSLVGGPIAPAPGSDPVRIAQAPAFPLSPHAPRADPPVVDPVPAEAAPQAVVTVPTDVIPHGGVVFLDASRSVSKYPLVYSVTPDAPIVSMDKGNRQGVYGVIMGGLQPDTLYLGNVMALGRNPSGDPMGAVTSFWFRTAPKPDDVARKKPVIDDNITPVPTPAPVPAPVPPVAPVAPLVPVAEPCYFTLVYPKSDRTTNAVRMAGMPALLEPFKITWHAIDDSSRAIEGGQLSQKTFVEARGLAPFYNSAPTLFVQRGDGSFLTGPDGKAEGYGVISPAYADPDKITALAKKIRGSN